MDNKENDYDESDLRWKPKISVKSVSKALSGVVDKGLKIIDNTASDLKYFFDNIRDCVEGCGANLDKIRLRLTHRAIQYISLVTGVLCSTALIPTDILDLVFRKVRGKLEPHDKPKIFQLTNPEKAVWYGYAPKFTEIKPEEFKNTPGRKSYVFIHGMCFKAVKKDGSDFSKLNINDHKTSSMNTDTTKTELPFPDPRKPNEWDAYDYFYNFEREAKIFKNNSADAPDSSKIDIYLVSYDSEMRDEDERIIRDVLKSYILGGGNFYLFIAAVFWKEMKERAKEAADYIKPFLIELKGNRGVAVTHSLGCYVLAHAAEQINKGRDSVTAHRSFGAWFCMSAALPSDAFSNTGEFEHAPLIAGTYDSPKGRYGTTVWFSLMDIVLMLIYPLGECTTALGLTGIGVNDNRYAEDYDITGITDGNHGPDESYMRSLGPEFREIFNTKS